MIFRPITRCFGSRSRKRSTTSTGFLRKPKKFNGRWRVSKGVLQSWGVLRSPLQWTWSISPCFSYGRGDGYSANLSEQWFCIRTRPRINCGLVSKTHWNGLFPPTVKCARFQIRLPTFSCQLIVTLELQGASNIFHDAISDENFHLHFFHKAISFLDREEAFNLPLINFLFHFQHLDLL